MNKAVVVFVKEESMVHHLVEVGLSVGDVFFACFAADESFKEGRGGKSTKLLYSSKSTITLLKFYLSTSKSTSLKIYSSKSKK